MLHRLTTVALAAALAATLVPACSPTDAPAPVRLVLPASTVGAEARVLRRQLRRFMHRNPVVQVVQRAVPDAAGQRRQLYVQWLNARAARPDILQLDVTWTPEFAAAGWILPLDRFAPEPNQFFASAVRANRWGGRLYALPWFVDVGMLYWRTDLIERAPRTFAELERQARAARRAAGAEAVPYGLVWQGARYEGLVCVFLEYLGGHGGRILSPQISIVSPLYLVLRGLGLIDTYPGLVLPYLTFAMPLTVWLLVGYFHQLPREIEESALVDGASRLRVLWEIVIPLSLPGIATTAILTFIYCWNEFLFALSFTLGPKRHTVPVAIALFRGRYQVPWGQILAAAVVATAPVAALMFLFQRRIVSGLTSGAVKE